MLDFAKSIMVGNAYTEADRKRLYELAGKRNKTAAEWAEFDELNRREEQASKEMLKRLGKTKNSKVGNELKYANLAEAKKMCQQMNDALAPDAALRHYHHVYEKDGVYYVMETGEAAAKGMKKVGNSKVGNYSADAFLSNAKSFAKEWSAKADGYAKAGDKQGLETLMRSAEAKFDELRRYKDDAYQAYKDSSDVLEEYKSLGHKISKLLK